ncbi:ParB/Srx family N-terminal domain-containing protein [Patescibacteria group bacterium]|nr:ParB/Srx family N-terminal domain-containing protein [Patescibacteria group bacterium]
MKRIYIPKVEMVSLNKIKPYPNNAKKHTQEQVRKVSKSMELFGFMQFIVIDKSNNIVVGHCRYDCAKNLNMEKIPCVRMEDCNAEAINAYRIIDNKLNESGWNEQKLNLEIKTMPLELQELTIMNIDLDIEDISDNFTLPSGEKSNLEQITFTLSQEQATLVKSKISDTKKTENFKFCETFGNENSNGNALYCLLRDIND